MLIPVSQISGYFFWCIVQQDGGVNLRSSIRHNHSACCLNWGPFCQIFFFFAYSSLCLFGICVMYVCWSALLYWCSDSMLCRVWTSLPCLYCPHLILFLLLLWQVCRPMDSLAGHHPVARFSGVLPLLTCPADTDVDSLCVLCTLFQWIDLFDSYCVVQQ
jgi:hypothetical protein